MLLCHTLYTTVNNHKMKKCVFMPIIRRIIIIGGQILILVIIISNRCNLQHIKCFYDYGSTCVLLIPCMIRINSWELTNDC